MAASWPTTGGVVSELLGWAEPSTKGGAASDAQALGRMMSTRPARAPHRHAQRWRPTRRPPWQRVRWVQQLRFLPPWISSKLLTLHVNFGRKDRRARPHAHVLHLQWKASGKLGHPASSLRGKFCSPPPSPLPGIIRTPTPRPWAKPPVRGYGSSSSPPRRSSPTPRARTRARGPRPPALRARCRPLPLDLSERLSSIPSSHTDRGTARLFCHIVAHGQRRSAWGRTFFSPRPDCFETDTNRHESAADTSLGFGWLATPVSSFLARDLIHGNCCPATNTAQEGNSFYSVSLPSSYSRFFGLHSPDWPSAVINTRVGHAGPRLRAIDEPDVESARDLPFRRKPATQPRPFPCGIAQAEARPPAEGGAACLRASVRDALAAEKANGAPSHRTAAGWGVRRPRPPTSTHATPSPRFSVGHLSCERAVNPVADSRHFRMIPPEFAPEPHAAFRRPAPKRPASACEAPSV
jgi:hypothetical protein